MTNGRYAGFLCRNLHTSALLTQHKSLKHNKLKIEQKSFYHLESAWQGPSGPTMVRRLYANLMVTGWVGGMVNGWADRRAGNQDIFFSSSPSLSFRQKSSEEGGESPLVI